MRPGLPGRCEFQVIQERLIAGIGTALVKNDPAVRPDFDSLIHDAWEEGLEGGAAFAEDAAEEVAAGGEDVGTERGGAGAAGLVDGWHMECS